MESVFAYLDYRKFLQDYFRHMKLTRRGFSLKVLADRAGFRARDYLMRVMRGERNLSKTGIYRLSGALGFSEKEADFFENLVAFNQAKTSEEKRHFYERLSRVGRFVKHQRLRVDQFEYLSQWYHCAIRSLLPVMDFRDDFSKLGAYLDPPISPVLARKSVQLLLDLGLLVRDDRGKYSAPVSALSTGDEVATVALATFHKAVLDLAKRSIDRHLHRDREMGGVTLSLSAAGFARIRAEVQEFRKRVMEIAAHDTGEDRVCQLCVHLFPLSGIGGPA